MPDITAISGMITSLKAAGDIAKALVGLRDFTLIQDKIIELQGVIITAQSSAILAQQDQFTLLERERELEKEVADLKTWDAEKEKYELAEISSGVFAYTLKQQTSSSEPKHYLCSNCYHQGHKSILQAETRTPPMAHVLECSECGATIYLSGLRPHPGLRPRN